MKIRLLDIQWVAASNIASYVQNTNKLEGRIIRFLDQVISVVAPIKEQFDNEFQAELTKVGSPEVNSQAWFEANASVANSFAQTDSELTIPDLHDADFDSVLFEPNHKKLLSVIFVDNRAVNHIEADRNGIVRLKSKTNENTTN